MSYTQLHGKARRVARQREAREKLFASGLTARGTPLRYPERRGSLGKMCYGRGGLPAEAVAAMYADYKRLNSLAKTGKLWGRTRQSMFTIFANHGLKLNERKLQAPIEYGSRKYTPWKNGYYRDTIFRFARPFQGEHLLHRRIWVDANGPIPAGYEVGFKDGNPGNVTLDNLVCLSPLAMRQKNRTGENQFTITAHKRLGLLISGAGKRVAALKR